MPAAFRHGQREVDEPLHVAGGSKQPISDDTEELVTQNWVALQLLQGSAGVPPLLDEVPASGAEALPHRSIASHDVALTMQSFVASEKPAQVDAHPGGVAEHVFVIDAHTSVHDLVVPAPPPLLDDDADASELSEEQAATEVSEMTRERRRQASRMGAL